MGILWRLEPQPGLCFPSLAATFNSCMWRLELEYWRVHSILDRDSFAISALEYPIVKLSSIPKSSPSTYHQRLKNQAFKADKMGPGLSVCSKVNLFFGRRRHTQFKNAAAGP